MSMITNRTALSITLFSLDSQTNSATYFIGNGSQLTGLPATYANSNVALYLPTYTGAFAPGSITISNANPNYFSYAFKPAIIKSVEINYAPEGQPSFFGETQAPTAVELRMELLEIEYWTQSDFGGTSPSVPSNLPALFAGGQG